MFTKFVLVCRVSFIKALCLFIKNHKQALTSNSLLLIILPLALLSINVNAQTKIKNKQKNVITKTSSANSVNSSEQKTNVTPIVSLTDPAKIYSRGESISVEIIGGAGGGFESYVASSSINVPNDGRYNIGNINQPGLYILRFIARGGVEKFNYGVLILPSGTTNKFTVKLTAQVTSAEVPVESSNALTKFWGLINQTRIKKAWSDAFPNWLATQGPGVAAIGITCAVTISVTGGAVIGLCIKEVGGATFDLIATVFSKLADNLRTEGALNQNETRIVKAVISLLKNAPNLITAKNLEFGEIIAGLKTINEILLEQHQDLQLTFSLVLDTASRANFMFDVNRRINP